MLLCNYLCITVYQMMGPQMDKNLVLSTECKLTTRSDEGLTLETSAFRIPVRWSIYIINSVDKTKFLYTTSPPTQHHSFFRSYSLPQIDSYAALLITFH